LEKKGRVRRRPAFRTEFKSKMLDFFKRRNGNRGGGVPKNRTILKMWTNERNIELEKNRRRTVEIEMSKEETN